MNVCGLFFGQLISSSKSLITKIKAKFICAYNKICSDYNQNMIIIKVDYLCIGVWMKVDYLV